VGPDGEMVSSTPKLTGPGYSQSLERGLAILACFTYQRRLRGIADMADELGMSRATTHRYASTLVALGYLGRGTRPKYELGLRVVDLGMAALDATPLREYSRGCLENLRHETSLAVSLAVLDGQDALLIDHIGGFRPLVYKTDLRFAAASRLPLHSTALGKLLMAYLPQDERDRVVSGLTLTKDGPKTITSKARLRYELERVGEMGLAVEDEEFAPGLIALAAPIRYGSGEVRAALGITAHIAIVSANQLMQRFASRTIVAAGQLSAQLDSQYEDEAGFPRGL
jgi:DNA-binding IclR family transcriptional regulator